MKIRIIIDKNNNKMLEQYKQICNLIPSHSLYIYTKGNINIEDNVDYNIFIDIVSERILDILCPSSYNILLVNEEYIYHQYLRRESYIDKRLRFINDVIDYYICLTTYSKNILIQNKIHKNKIKYFNVLVDDIYSTKFLNFNNHTLRYIIYDVDLYSGQNNVIMLQTWIKYFLHRDEYLIICYKYHKDAIVRLNIDLQKRGIYKNIILVNDCTKYMEANIYASIINTSYYNLTTILNEYLIKKCFIITTENKVINNYSQKMLLMKSFCEEELYKSLNKLFEYNLNDISNIVDNNKKILLKDSYTNKKKIYKYFNCNIKDKHEIFYIQNNKITNSSNRMYIPSLIRNSHTNIKNKILKIDTKFNKIIDNNNYNKYYRILKKPIHKTEYAYATIIIFGNSYISSILSTGYIMKFMNKTKYNLICFVQDKPYYENDILKFKGLTEDEINDIGLFYDCIVGIDILKIITNKTFKLHYTNAIYFATKLICYGFTYYSKILYYDASAIIQNNIDYYMTKYNENKYYNTNNDDLNRGMVGNIYLFKPKSYYIDKALYLLQNYSNIFDNEKFFYLPDENLLYYTIYPHWSNKQIDFNEIQANLYVRIPYINYIKKKEKHLYNFNLYIIIKPFLYNDNGDDNGDDESNFITMDNSTFYNANHMCYEIWDISINKIIKMYPILNKYVEYIKTYRYTKF